MQYRIASALGRTVGESSSLPLNQHMGTGTGAVSEWASAIEHADRRYHHVSMYASATVVYGPQRL